MNSGTETEEHSTLSVIVGMAFTDADGVAFDQAVSLTEGVAKSELHLVHVLDAEQSERLARELVDHLRLYVNEKAAAHGGLGPTTVGIHLRAGKPVPALVQLATEVHADLIVIGSRENAHPHLNSGPMGSTAEHLIEAAPCPVLVAVSPSGIKF
jgi:universal stress protein G